MASRTAVETAVCRLVATNAVRVPYVGLAAATDNDIRRLTVRGAWNDVYPVSPKHFVRHQASSTLSTRAVSFTVSSLANPLKFAGNRYVT